MLILTATLLELEYATLLVEVRGQWLLPLLWRAAAWLGVALLVAAPVLLVRGGGWAKAGAVRRTHLAVLAAAAVGLALTVAYWTAF